MALISDLVVEESSEGSPPGAAVLVETRAGRFLGIIVIPRYCNETISVSRRFRRNDNITISILLRFLVFVTAY